MPDQNPFATEPLPTPADYNALDHFRRRGLAPSVAQYVTLDDRLILRTILSSLFANANVRVSLRIQMPDGQIVPQQQQYLVAGSGLGFADFGVHTLRGVPGEWRLFRVQ